MKQVIQKVLSFLKQIFLHLSVHLHVGIGVMDAEKDKKNDEAVEPQGD